ncbi:Lrp/AsnC family transcriptional regulator [Actinobacteria bacterium YIM 96077]|uniref:Lrp/AsnC family transcriptional regulator n=1 Tax=Phytoactinopolyspora halophila TaxID=1981511 RepID=A0A329QHD2_9ACTN|nr:Lrp/AsnC family transcriptional regulator [Phytoactinopolyspora halophila]AYY14673.1 Lrp/AsnC family transcriptional regulator [Actinobacteria bacterium YIM 96077]RAW11616.1 Lrp/AsnC family transcriptional regulator [Phytoactinopolyspora halophila]
MQLDEVDRRILQVLSEDGRASYGAIGAEVNLSAPAVKRRVDRLRERGVITGFTIGVDAAASGWTTEAYVELFCNRRTAGAEILRRAETYPEVVEAFTVTGDADALLHVFAADMQHFERVLSEISAEPFVARTRSVLVLSPLLRRNNLIM